MYPFEKKIKLFNVSSWSLLLKCFCERGEYPVFEDRWVLGTVVGTVFTENVPAG